jgi:hypothetical protein
MHYTTITSVISCYNGVPIDSKHLVTKHGNLQGISVIYLSA